MVYEEIEHRRAMLQALHAELEATDEQDLLITTGKVQQFGEQIGLSPRPAVRLFVRLIEEGYIRTQRTSAGALYNGIDAAPFISAIVLDLTDEGMRLIDLLPAEDSVEGVVKALEAYLQQVEEEEAPAEEKERKRTAIQKAITGLRAVAVEVGPKLLAEAMWKGMGM
jgi:hypothetical protein